MLKKRVIATLIIKDDRVVQSISFNRYLPVGSVEICVENLNRFGVDEIILLDIDASKQNKIINQKLVELASKASFVPICVGGGLKTLDDIELTLKSGADKVAINHSFWQDPSFCKAASKVFGKQCIIVSLDTFDKKRYDYFSKTVLSQDVAEAAKFIQESYAGEILLNNIHRDGAKVGLDIELIKYVCDAVSLPIIAIGGVGNAMHIKEALEVENLSAVAVGNFFHFIEHSVNITKGLIASKSNILIRNESYANYKEANFDEEFRIAKKSDEELKNMFFEYHQEEII
jgi:cyclase